MNNPARIANGDQRQAAVTMLDRLITTTAPVQVPHNAAFYAAVWPGFVEAVPCEHLNRLYAAGSAAPAVGVGLLRGRVFCRRCITKFRRESAGLIRRCDWCRESLGGDCRVHVARHADIAVVFIVCVACGWILQGPADRAWSEADDNSCDGFDFTEWGELHGWWDYLNEIYRDEMRREQEE
ncbi:MAG TPA: hypothetical protein VFU43_18695 [Streptosporangiaceae bacterium]|nr:hypothetical protein [Streptosporangiaceae bacterium]